MTNDEKALLVATTLRFLACGWVTGDGDDREWLAETAAHIEHLVSGEFLTTEACCPLCEEVSCDDHCPMRGLRAQDQ